MSIAKPLQDYRGLIEACRQRAEEMAISRLEIDRLAGLPSGYSAKLLGRADVAKPRRMFPVSLGAILGTLGLKLIVIEDEAATARTLALREPVDRANQRFGNVSRMSATLLSPPQADSSPPALSIVRTGTRRGSKYG